MKVKKIKIKIWEMLPERHMAPLRAGGWGGEDSRHCDRERGCQGHHSHWNSRLFSDSEPQMQ